MTTRLRVGIDVGGTFTDLFAYDEISGEVHTHKVSSTPAEPHRAPVEGLRELLERIGATGSSVVFVGLGTTVATNALLEGKGARTGVITTRGFRDLLEIGRQTRPHLYDPFVRKPDPIVPRTLRMEASERTAADGSIVTPLDEADVRQCAMRLKEAGIESIAICFLNAYINPGHELRAAQIVRDACPGAEVVASSEVVPEFREYERFMSSVINAYLAPTMRAYFERFAGAIATLSITVPPLVMSSSGGVFSTATAGARPIDTLFSGPSGGVSGALFVSGLAGIEDIVTFDMGGTSTEVCLVRKGKPQLSHKRVIRDFPIRTTSYDIHTIGAGGSSIASIDAGGMLQLGPRSAGADPGPACYATGGAFATVTDANMVLGRLNQAYLLGGALKVDCEKSRRAIRREVADPKGIGVEQAAASIVALAEANMAQAIRVVSVERGIDPKDFTLVALGGAGPLHAAAVAREVGMAAVLVPLHPGVLCAMGILAKDIQLNFSRTTLIRASNGQRCGEVEAAFMALEDAARSRMASQEASGRALRFERSAAIRYEGQNHEIDVPVTGAAFDQSALQATRNAFDRAHTELYGYGFEHNDIEIVTLRVAALIEVARPRLEPAAEATSGTPGPSGNRHVLFAGSDARSCPIFQRHILLPGHALDGPAIVEQMDTTVVIPPGFRCVVDPWQNLRLTWTP